MTRRIEPEVDIIVVGLGGAGACAAIEAASRGARVVVLERFAGGGATAISGGVVYAGGGTHIQREAGVEDDVEAMADYLRDEIGDVVCEETLKTFCRESAANLRWLTEHGVPFDASLCPVKTSYPSDEYFLYYSGNEGFSPWRERARPAPRGHRTFGEGLPGRRFFEPLRSAALAAGAALRNGCRVRALLRDEGGRVHGVEYDELPAGPTRWLHARIDFFATKVSPFVPALGRGLRALGSALERHRGRRRTLRAERGVILATGGYIYNPEMVTSHAPAYARGLPMGTAGCSGEGIEMAQALGAVPRHLDRISAWFFLNPPSALCEGVLVNREGQRFVNEALYGASVGRALVETSAGAAFLVIDRALWRRARAQLGRGKTQLFQTLPALFNLWFNCRRAGTATALARRIGCETSAIEATLERYNADIRSARPDAMSKDERVVLKPPYYAIDCSLDDWRWPLMMLSLGGLAVDEDSGGVLGNDDKAIPGLFAAGRVAVGICSNQYVSGLSLADCVHSGRRAGACAARSGGRDTTGITLD